MTKWEYRTFSIRYNKKKHKDWVVKTAKGSLLIGLQAILTAHGVDGWELVGLNPDFYETFAGFAKWHVEPVIYRATFKRPVEA